MTTSPTTRAAGERRAAVGVDELRRAWRAAQAGQFRRGRPGLATATLAPPPGPPTPSGSLPLTGLRWEPFEPVVAVVACSGPTGASAVALAMATVAGAARVIDCVGAGVSGLAAASTAELGRPDLRWVRASRDRVLIDRVDDPPLGAGPVPVPPVADRPLELSVVDLGCDVGQVAASGSWLSELLTGRVVVVSAATVPGMHRLERALRLLEHGDPVAVVLGPRRRRWPREAARELGPKGRALDRAGRLIDAPQNRRLRVRGLDAAPLPPPLLAAAADLLRLLDLTSDATSHATLEGHHA
jgi:hypothetical protein